MALQRVCPSCHVSGSEVEKGARVGEGRGVDRARGRGDVDRGSSRRLESLKSDDGLDGGGGAEERGGRILVPLLEQPGRRQSPWEAWGRSKRVEGHRVLQSGHLHSEVPLGHPRGQLV